jgi:hypothetical protein
MASTREWRIRGQASSADDASFRCAAAFAIRTGCSRYSYLSHSSSSKRVVSPAQFFPDQFRQPSRQARRRMQIENFFRRGQYCEQFQHVGGAVKAGLIAGIEFPETPFQDSGELLRLCPDLPCQIVGKARSD